LFHERRDEHDLCSYSEDDTLLTEAHIDAFVEESAVLPDDCIAGFMRYEVNPHGGKSYSGMHSHYHWDAGSVVRHGRSVFASHTNEHAACYILSRDQLHRAIASGGFMLPPAPRRYGMAETAATDPYTCCGMRKLVCISRFDDFCLHHLPNTYCGRIGLDEKQARLEIDMLLSLPEPEGSGGPLIQTLPLHDQDPRNKAYYERRRDDILRMVPSTAGRVLSVGCGDAATEAALAEKGIGVVAVPLDPVIATSGAGMGLTMLPADFEQAIGKISGCRFDLILMNDILQQLPDPVAVLRRFRGFLNDDGLMLVSVPNWNHCGFLRRRLAAAGRNVFRGGGADCGRSAHKTGALRVRGWLHKAGLRRVRQCGMPAARHAKWSRWVPAAALPLLCEKLLFVGRR
jgi:2-polyprenyl-3-methyl-5-hydroxy-6-metoxy-1,4-benzoquinol methylase